MKRRNLVVVRCGRNSLHAGWIAGDSSRNFDLALCPFEASPDARDLPPRGIIPGQKWTGLHAYLTADRDWRQYEYVWLPDDDLATNAADVSRLFDLCQRFAAQLAAPALSEDSQFYYPITMRNRSFFARATTFIDVMAPCMRSDILERLLPTLADSQTGFGWGLPIIWPKLLGFESVYMFDDVAMRHVRPIGAMRSAEQKRAAQAERWRLLDKYQTEVSARTLHAYDAEARRLPIGEGRFQLEYIEGYSYLIERDPTVLATLALDQIGAPGLRHWQRARRRKVQTIGPLAIKPRAFWAKRLKRRLKRIFGRKREVP